jgi:hypothetical protein
MGLGHSIQMRGINYLLLMMHVWVHHLLRFLFLNGCKFPQTLSKLGYLRAIRAPGLEQSVSDVRIAATVHRMDAMPATNMT